MRLICEMEFTETDFRDSGVSLIRFRRNTEKSMDGSGDTSAMAPSPAACGRLRAGVRPGTGSCFLRLANVMDMKKRISSPNGIRQPAPPR